MTDGNRFIALLRGVNVGGRGRMAMSDLREAMLDLGHGDVETYLQSGNAVFTSSGTDTASLAAGIERTLEDRLGVDIRVLVRSPDEVAGLVASNPFAPAAATEPAKLHLAFLSDGPDPERLAGLDSKTFAPDRFHPGERALYLWYPNGAGRSKLTGSLLERRLGVTATARNWNTVLALVERSVH